MCDLPQGRAPIFVGIFSFSNIDLEYSKAIMQRMGLLQMMMKKRRRIEGEKRSRKPSGEPVPCIMKRDSNRGH